ncbi:MAG: PAS domain-containing sensor histidine kinase [Candidatus Saganbacteria bacterium]|nr:PAS domain-containing sensor histidine kinase [Candidatus Saganbacteria bacterium]
MTQKDRTKERLIEEIKLQQKRIAELETTNAERKREAEEARRMVTVVRDSNDAITIHDFDGRITAWNHGAELMFGYSEKEALQMTIWQLAPPNKAAEQKDFNRRLFAGEKVYSFDTQRLTKDGRLLDVWLTVTKLVDDAGKVIGIAATERDVTERKKTEKEKKAAEESKIATEIKSKFTSMVSHELRSPLAAIKEGVNLVVEGLIGDINDKQKDMLTLVKNNVDRLARLINNVLDFQKIQAKGMEFKLLPNDINEVASEVAKTMNVMAEIKQLSITTNFDDNVPKIKFDKDRINQVITNLVSNAIKLTEKGSIVIGTKAEHDEVHVMVQDTGPGIKNEDIQKLFQPFEQLDSARDRKKGGSGLGLAISKDIITAHKGNIWAESEFGKGATFHFTLPVK